MAQAGESDGSLFGESKAHVMVTASEGARNARKTIDRLYAGALQLVNALCLAVLGGARGLPGWEPLHT